MAKGVSQHKSMAMGQKTQGYACGGMVKGKKEDEQKEMPKKGGKFMKK